MSKISNFKKLLYILIIILILEIILIYIGYKKEIEIKNSYITKKNMIIFIDTTSNPMSPFKI